MCTDCSSTNLPTVTNTISTPCTGCPVFQGAYDNSVQYSKNDLVYYLGSTYIATGTPTIGVLPTGANWSVFALGGTNGTSGQNGITGGVSFRYQFSTANSASNPGAGFLKADSGNSTLVTQIYINYNDASSGDLSSLFGLANGGNTLIKLFDSLNSDLYSVYLITTTVDHSTYYTLNCTYVTSTITNIPFFIANQNITIALGLNPS